MSELRVLPFASSPQFGRGPFRIRRIRPGLILGNDPALGPLSVVDFATLDTGTFVAMHEHRNDEILSYLWRGNMVHEDSHGLRVELGPQRLMMMNAGRSFYHEESVPKDPVRMLQIFIRPTAADLEPRVTFSERASKADNTWNLVGGPEGEQVPLSIRNQVYVYDAHLNPGSTLEPLVKPGFQQWIVVMDGVLQVAGGAIATGDSLAITEGNLPAISSREGADVVLFLSKLDAPASRAGTISGG